MLLSKENLSYCQELLSVSARLSASPPPHPVFNWKVMKFLFKEMMQVYKAHLIAETRGGLISGCIFYVCTSRLQSEGSVPLYEITWLLYQLHHLGPITSATDELL